MSDLISREDALDAVEGWMGYPIVDETLVRVMTDIKDLPSAQTSGDLISREETYKVLTDYYHHTTEVQHSGLREALGRVPSAERTGHWSEAERKKSEVFYCSVCGGRAYHPWMGSRNTDEKNKCRYAYCPNCGCRMKGEEE